MNLMVNDNNDKAEKKLKWGKRIIKLIIAINVLVIIYLFLVFSNIPFIAKWRNIYIETAMSTNSHQWLATWFLPNSVIDEIMSAKEANDELQMSLESNWDTEEEEIIKEKTFYDVYWELDSPTVRAYFGGEPDLEDDILFEDFDQINNLKTAEGDAVYVIDTANDLVIIGVTGDDYIGKLAIVHDTSRVEMVKSDYLGTRGMEATTYAERYDAALVINGSAFLDVGGHGSGGKIKGSTIINGIEYGAEVRTDWKFFGVKYDNRLYIGNYDATQIHKFRWATQFTPALIVDGVNQYDEQYGMGIHPRTAVGQTKNGDFLLLIVDGRQVGYSLGCTVWECANILERYDAYEAGNLDGGSSSVMVYKGTQITKSSSKSGRGRYMPSALIVRDKSKFSSSKGSESVDNTETEQ